MSAVGAFIMPIIVVSIIVFGLIKGVKVFDCFLEGARDGMKAIVSLLPSLVGLIVAVSLLRASGAVNIIVWLLSPISKFLGIPKDIMPLALLCPVSGSGSLSMYESILKQGGIDTFTERVSSVMMCSTETTFYVVTVYYGAVGIKKTRHTVPCALCADLTSFIMSAQSIRWFF